METKSSKWYQKTPIIIVLLLLFFPAGLFLMWKYSRWNSKLKGVITGIIGLLFIVTLVSNPSQSNSSQNSQPVESKQSQSLITPASPITANAQSSAPKLIPTPTPQPTTFPKYNVVYNENAGNDQNIMVNVNPSNDAQPTATVIALDVKKKNCSDKCNIGLYDDLRALQLQHDYLKNAVNYTAQEDDAWAKKNYVFVADHYVGEIQFELPNDFSYFPFKNDSEYQKYKSQ